VNECCEKLVKFEADMALQMAMMRRDFEELSEKVYRNECAILGALDRQSKSLEGLVDAWNNGTGFVKFVKWFAPVVVACISLWHLAKEFFKN